MLNFSYSSSSGTGNKIVSFSLNLKSSTNHLGLIKNPNLGFNIVTEFLPKGNTVFWKQYWPEDMEMWTMALPLPLTR